MNLDEEGGRATQMLKGKVVALVTRHRDEELCIEFADGTRLYVDRSETGVELTITGGSKNEIRPSYRRDITKPCS